MTFCRMNSPLPLSLRFTSWRVWSVAIVLLIVGAGLGAQVRTEDKIKLMTSALQARDAGDYATASRILRELQTYSPDDPSLKRLLSEIEQKAGATAAALDVPSVDEEAEAIARAETERLRNLLNAAEARRQTARQLAREQRHTEAIAQLDDTLAELPLNPLTQSVYNATQADKRALLVEQVRLLLQQDDLTGARIALGKYRQINPDDRTGGSLAQDIENAEARRLAASVEASAPTVKVSTPDDSVERLLLRARSQYVAGEQAAALQTFEEVLAIAPGNAEARRFSARIREELNAPDGKTRAATRRELLAEVDRSWSRPSVFEEQQRSQAAESNAAPLLRKLNDIVLPSVSFTKVEIGRVVSALGAASEEFDRSGATPRGVNIVLLDPEGQNPAVTLTLRNTSLRRVLDFVTQSVGYQYEVQADAVVVRPGGESTTLDTAFFPVSRATVLRMTGSAGVAASVSTDPFSSSGAGNDPFRSGNEAPAMQAFLQQAGVNFEATAGSSLAYDGSSIIVTQTARNLERIRNILNRYNNIRQVEIEAKFMEVQEGALEELGVNWNVATKATQRNAGAQAEYQSSNRPLATAFNSSIGTQQGSIVRPGGQIVNQDGSVTVNPDVNIPISSTPTQIPGSAYLGVSANPLVNISGVIGEFDVNAVVRALSQQQGSDLLSAPKVTVLSGNPATITVAQELRYPQSFGQTQSQVGTGSASGGGSAGVAITAGTPQEFTTRNVGVELKVTPTVEEDDYSISLDLNPKVTEFDGFVEYGGPSVAISGNTTVNVPSGFYQPIFSVRDISTKVTIWDGATLIMGGLTREEVKKVNDKVPVLGDLPLLGRMFRSKGESAQKRNLLIFVTANLLSPGGSPKNQAVGGVAPNSLFQNPVIITPGGAGARSDRQEN